MRRLSMIGLCLALLWGLAAPVLAGTPEGADAKKPAFTAAAGKIQLDSRSYVQLEDVYLLQRENGNDVSFSLTFYNGRSEDMLFNDYFVRVTAKSGTTFDVNQLPQNREQNRIPPGVKRTYHFYTKVDSYTRLDDLVFTLIKWDLNAPDLERRLGALTVPKGYVSATPMGSAREIRLDGFPLKTSVEAAYAVQNDQYILPTVYFSIENIGHLNATLPDLNFSIRTGKGAVYSLEPNSALAGKIIAPGIAVRGTLSGSIPVSAGKEGWTLIVSRSLSERNGTAQGNGSTQQEGNGDARFTVAEYQLPVSEQPEQKAEKTEAPVHLLNGKYGTYSVVFDSLQVWPWREDDLLTASFTLSNPGTKALPVPAFTGYFRLDHAVSVPGTVIRTDRAVTLQPGQSMQVFLQGRLPFSDTFSSAEIFLQTADGADSASTVSDVLYLNAAETEAMPLIGEGKTHVVNNAGGKWEIAVSSVDTFAGDMDDIFSVELTAENKEKRYLSLMNFVAQFRAADGTVFPAEISNVEKNIVPGGKAALTVWTVLPKGYDTKGMELIVGEGITGGEPAPKGAQPDSFVKAVSYRLPEENRAAKEDFDQIELFPYVLTIENFRSPYLYLQKLAFEFKYKLERNLTVEKNLEGHHFLLELEDAYGEVILSQALDFEELSSGNPVLELGSHDMELLTEMDEETLSIRPFTLNIYHQFQPGHKKLLASQTYGSLVK